MFSGTERPTFADFAYFSFTIGTSFATSDVEVRPAMRSRVLAHTVVAFLYNTVNIAIAVSVIT
ncbi:hypothetical protein GCM10023148_48720 [Actinokineospora soli]